MKTWYRFPAVARTCGALLLLWPAARGYAQGSPPAASVASKVQVPASMRTAPFDVDRYLNVPPDFSVAVYARVGAPRFMALAPNGDLLVSQPSTGKVLLVRPNGSADPAVSDFATGLRNPHDIVFHTIGATTYVYITESNQINRYTYTAGNLTAQNREIIITGLPDASTPELHGNYAHTLKNIALDSNHKLYVSVASSCNACLEDTQSDPVRGAIYQYNADGTGRRLFARGLRNAEGLAFVPGTTRLWAIVNNRDNIAYPFNQDFDGDGTSDLGKVLTPYVDNHPPEEFTYVQDGGNYGWPFCNPDPDQTLDNMPFDRDYQFNASGQVDCNGMTRISRGIQAHSAPLGLTFMPGTNFANPYRSGAVAALHGSWNRAAKTGYKVVYFPWNSATQAPTGQVDLVTGFLNDATQAVLGRPVDAAVDPQGDLFISDDYSGTIYKLSYLRTPENPTGTAAGLNYQYYQGQWTALPNFGALAPAKTGSAAGFDLGPRTQDDYFGFRYSGYVSVPADGLYTFYTTSDDGSRLSIGNQVVVDNDGLHGAQERSGTIRLKAGRHALTVDFFEYNGGQTLGVSYQGPGLSKQPVPASALSSVPSAGASGSGLAASYFNSQDLSGSAVLNRVEAAVDNDWGTGSPAAGTVNTDHFSARWTGQVQAPVSGSYTFTTVSDDGVRLWVNGQPVINNWTVHAPTANSSAAVALVAGQKYDVRLEFYENQLGAVCRLQWSYPGQATQAIPQRQLFPTTGASAAARGGLATPSASDALAVYPNPATDRLTVNATLVQAGPVTLGLANALGQVVRQRTLAAPAGPQALPLDVRGLPAGLYLLRVQQGSTTTTQKVLLQP